MHGEFRIPAIPGPCRADPRPRGAADVRLMYGVLSAVSRQKSVRDRLEDVPVTAIYFGLCWLSVAMALVLLAIGSWNAALQNTEKGFCAMAFLLSLFGGVAVQKNVRDVQAFQAHAPATSSPEV